MLEVQIYIKNIKKHFKKIGGVTQLEGVGWGLLL